MSQSMLYEETLNFTQDLRKQVAQDITKEGIPTDLDTIKVLLTTLKDMDGTAINDKKVRVEEQNATSNSEIAQAVAQYAKLHGDGSPFKRNPDGSAIDTASAIPVINERRLGEHEIVDGELEIGISHETSREFMERMQIDKGSA